MLCSSKPFSLGRLVSPEAKTEVSPSEWRQRSSYQEKQMYTVEKKRQRLRMYFFPKILSIEGQI
jgi:hypothetical protein